MTGFPAVPRLRGAQSGLESTRSIVTPDGNDRLDYFGRLRGNLRHCGSEISVNSCVLFDTTKLVRDLENAYKMMWNDYLTDNLPVPDLENLELYQDIATDMDYDLIGLLNFDDIFENYQNSVVKNDRYLMKTTKFRFSGTGKS
jgi:hypothetical protein